ncbi:MAG: hypothetical protein M3N10_00420 [Actinomycetota bacterium]|nr:hypothetical protein [Actinomycetota bacterium]
MIGGIWATFIPIAISVAILKYRLYDIDFIINRTLVYAALTACVVGLYMLVVGGLGTLLHSQGNLLLSLLGAGLVAVLFAPLRDRLQRGVNRLMYGERDDPYKVLSWLGRRLEANLAPEAVLPAVVENIARALHLPRAEICSPTARHSAPEHPTVKPRRRQACGTPAPWRRCAALRRAYGRRNSGLTAGTAPSSKSAV